MNRKKVLFLYEMRYVAVFAILALITAIGIILDLDEVLGENLQLMHGVSFYRYSAAGRYPQGTVFAYVLVNTLQSIILPCIPVLLIMVAVQYSDIQVRGKREYLNSLPFRQGEKLGMKLCLGYGVLTAMCGIISIGVFCLRAKYQPRIMRYNALSISFKQFMQADTVWHTIRTMVFFWLVLIAMYSVFVLVSYLVRSSVLAAVAGSCAVLHPALINQFFIYVAQTDAGITTVRLKREEIEGALIFFKRISRYTQLFMGETLGYTYGSLPNGSLSYEISNYIPHNNNLLQEYAVTVSYGNVWLSFALVILIIGICLALIWRINQTQDLARIQHRIPTKVGRALINYGASTLAGIILLSLVEAFLFWGTIPWQGALAMWIIFSVVFYQVFRLTKIWKAI